MTTPSHSTRWDIVALAIGCGIAASLQVGKVPSALPILRHDLNLGLVGAGWIASIFNATGATIGVLAGVVADRLGRRALLLVGLALLALGSLCGAASPAAAALFGSRILEGLGFVAVVVAAPSLIAEAAAAKDQRLALGTWGIYLSTGMGGMMLLTPPLLGRLGWRGLWLAEALLLVALLPLVAWRTRPAAWSGRPGRPATGWADLGHALRRPGPWLLALSFGLYTIQWFAMMNWLPTFLIERVGLGLGAAAAASGAVVIVNAPGNLCGAWLLQRGLPRWALIATAQLVMAAAAQAVFADAVPAATKIAAALGFSFLGGLLPAACLSGVPAHARSPAEIGAVNGLLIQGSNLGTLLGTPAMAALVTWRGGWQQSAWLLLVAGTLGAGVALGVRAVERWR